MKNESFIPDLFSFIEQSPTPFHASALMRRKLIGNQFSELAEGKQWHLEKGKRYFVRRNGAVIAFCLSTTSKPSTGFRMIGAHTDSPALQLKPNTRENQDPYLVAGVEKYGGVILHTWFDRELSLAGRVSCVSSLGDTLSLLIDFKKPVAFIPSLAIHLDRTVNDGHALNVQNELSPILAQTDRENHADLNSMIQDQLYFEYPEFKGASILGFDLFCYDPGKPSFFGLNDDFIAASRLDNLLSCHIGLEALCQADAHTNSMLICTNHEEIGSTSNSGALGNFPDVILSRILGTAEEKAVCLHNSFLLSLDNAHATHPNYKEKSDGDHQILLNHGPVIKLNASQRYATNANTGAVFRILASESEVKTQDFVMRSDMVCGSTIGPLSSAKLGIDTVDIGIPTWGMHSIREVTGASDPALLHRVVCHYLNRKTLPHFRADQS
jgi:aspartyl aminopeptidase